MRRRRAAKRKIIPDPKYNSILVAKFINMVMRKGKKSTADRIVYRCFDLLCERTKQQDPIELFKKAVDNARPLLEVKPRRVGGATYQVPVEVKPERGTTIRNFARLKKGRPMEEKLADEILAAYKKEGSAIKKREDTHKMAESNKAFAHYRW